MERTERHGPLMGDNQNSRATTIRIPDRKECLTPDRPRKPTEFCAVAHSEGSGPFARDALENSRNSRLSRRDSSHQDRAKDGDFAAVARSVVVL
jgi:hypothetical protein